MMHFTLNTKIVDSNLKFSGDFDQQQGPSGPARRDGHVRGAGAVLLLGAGRGRRRQVRLSLTAPSPLPPDAHSLQYAPPKPVRH
ncbi:hypothetical protein ON010_g5691 [Phytophthora cinnamomi]|nr:hypothetical protein ON010_g5691 [Phytophthora cinnamomi]